MSFKVEKPQADFTIVCNAILRDARISLRAKGLYALMVSKPEGWIFHEAAMLKEFTEGRDALRGAFKELIDAKWLSKLQPREGGKFNHNVYRIHSTVDWKTVDGGTADGKTPPSNTDVSKTETATARISKFNEFWELFPRKVSRPHAERAWRTNKCDEHFGAVMEGLTRWVNSTDWLSRPADKLPYPATWLNGQRWNDLPSVVVKPSKPGEIKFRESTPDEKADTRLNQEIMRLRKLPENLRATDDELAEKARDALR